MTTPASAEPTAEQIEAALAALEASRDKYGDFDWEHGHFSIARAIAAAVTAEREKYLRVADELVEYADIEREAHERAVAGQYMYDVFLHRGRKRVADGAARRIREVSR